MATSIIYFLIGLSILITLIIVAITFSFFYSKKLKRKLKLRGILTTGVVVEFIYSRVSENEATGGLEIYDSNLELTSVYINHIIDDGTLVNASLSGFNSTIAKGDKVNLVYLSENLNIVYDSSILD